MCYPMLSAVLVSTMIEKWRKNVNQLCTVASQTESTELKSKILSSILSIYL